MAIDSTQFDKMMNGELSMIAPLSKPEALSFLEMGASEQKELIERKKEPISEQMNSEVQKFITHMRNKKAPERRIRRAVLKKFNIILSQQTN